MRIYAGITSALAALLAVLPPVVAQAQPPSPPSARPAAAPAANPALNIGAVRPSNLVLPQLAVTDVSGGATGQVVSADLALADVATPPSNAAAVIQAENADRQAGAFTYDAWTQAGINYVVRISGGQGGAEAELFDVASKRRLFGNNYSKAGDGRALAHKIADDVMTAITGRPGIFSSRICYLSERGRGSREVSVMDADGAGQRQLTRDGSMVATPCWGQNGAEVIYTTYRDNNPDLAGTTLAGKRFDVSRRPGLNTAPSWSQSKGRLAVSLSKDGNPEIYTMSREGRNLARLTNSPDVDTAPDWSPDGAMIAFTSNRSGSPQIYAMDASGSGARRISAGNYCDSPAWSPDGSKIAYVAREGGEFNIYIADVAGGGAPVRVTSGQKDNTDPSWAPDSRHLVFSSTRGGSRDLYMMNLDTKTAKPLTRGAGATSPAWSPLTQ